MAGSLSDQLLKAGLVNKKSVHKTKKQKQQHSKLERKGNVVADHSDSERLAAEKAAKIERDRQLNMLRIQSQREKEAKIQVAQLLSQHRIRVEDGEVKYHYSDAQTQKVKSLYVTALHQEQLARGIIAICNDDKGAFLVPRILADKAFERYPPAVSYVASVTVDAESLDDDDPYKDFQIPDDLMW